MTLLIKKWGFTLIELVIVILVLGILAIVAIPQFVDLSGDANRATVRGIAGALASANTVNYTARKANSTYGVPISNCTNVASALVNSTLPTSYAITSLAITAGTSATCTLTGPTGSVATFIATGIS